MASEATLLELIFENIYYKWYRSSAAKIDYYSSRAATPFVDIKIKTAIQGA